MYFHNLQTLFQPKGIAVIGASTHPGKLGYDVFSNLATLHYQGKLYPVNPAGGEILGQTVYKNLSEIKATIDLGIIIVPALFVTKVLDECGKQGIKNIIIISAGFKEIGAEGLKREKEIQKLIQKYKLNLIGPNCLGIINTYKNLNASFAEGMPAKGNIALVSQSGAMAVAITDWAYTHNLGFSKIISLGNKAGVSEIDLLEFLAKDKETKVILMYLESIENGQAFMQLAKKITNKKPVIIIKSGTSREGTKAISSHTGSLAGSNEAIKAAFKQSGILRADTIEDLFDYARAFSYQMPPKGKRIAIITNAGGPGIMATDSLEKRNLKLAELDPKRKKALAKVLPAAANLNNPIDLIGDALANRYEIALKSVLQDKNVDAVLVLLTPQTMTEEMKTAELIQKYNKKYPLKTILTCFMGGKNVAEAGQFLAQAKVPNFDYPDRAVKTLEKMYLFKALNAKKKTESWLKGGKKEVKVNEKIKENIRKKLKRNKGQIPINLALDLLKLYQIKVPQAEIASTAEEAIKIADKIGYPVVMKICSKEILHKTEAGGVRVSLKNAKEVQIAFKEILSSVRKYNPQAQIGGIFVQEMTTFGREVIIGMKRDAQFGPMMMFGLGGIYVEVLKDVTFRIAPLSRQDAQEMICEIKAIELLKGVRGEAPADLVKIAEVICSVSQMVIDFPEIQELDINPLIVREKGKEAVAIDVRMLV